MPKVISDILEATSKFFKSAKTEKEVEETPVPLHNEKGGNDPALTKEDKVKISVK